MKQFFKELFDGLGTATDGVIGKIIVQLFFNMLIELLKSNPRSYLNQRPVLKARIDRTIIGFFWNVQRPFMVYIFPLSMMFLVWVDPKLEPIDTPLTYLILCGMGFILGLLFDWAKPDLDKPMA